MVRKNRGNRLVPLNTKTENNTAFNNDERKLPHQLNPLPNKNAAAIDQKRVRSKIPILQKTTLCLNQKKDDIFCDTSLSAADRRQKFQQSRFRAAGVCTLSIDPMFKKQHAVQCCGEILPWYEGYVFHKVVLPSAPVMNQRSVLPPIKSNDVSIPLQKINQTRNKCLVGEFTHFPALCNPSCFKDRKHYTSTIPHLPPIVSLPPAPPSSISTSVENDGNKVSVKARENKWSTSRYTFQSGIPVVF